MKILFLLPSAAMKISGGFKVAYEYANGLAGLGHEVFVVHPANGLINASLARRAWRLVRWLHRRIDGTWKPNWFGSFSPGVALLWVPSLAPNWLPECDIVVYTSWQTAEWMPRINALAKVSIYLIHDYEHYMAAGNKLRERIAATFARAEAALLVTSPAGDELLARAGRSRDFYIPNAIDNRVFNSIGARVPRDGIGFPARNEKFKGTQDAITALEIVREKVGSGYHYWCFGDYSGPMPEWIKRYPRPSDLELAKLYRSSLVFMTASHYEGWGLPGSEAMACGAALASTEHGGVRAYAEHGKNSLLSPIRDPEALASNVIALLCDDELRERIAIAGIESRARVTWESSVREFNAMIAMLINRKGVYR